MNIQAGNILSSTPSFTDANFDHALVFITEHNQNGAVGFVTNKKTDRFLNQLVEFKDCIAFPLYFGGPVDQEHLFFLHRRPDIIMDGKEIADGIYYGGIFKQAVDALNNNSINEKDIKIFIGYCGWDFNQLVEELEEGGWQIINDAAQTVF